MDLPLIVIGGGGHAKVLASTLLLQHRTVLGFVDPQSSLTLLSIPHLGGDDAVFLYAPDQLRLVNGVGSIDSTLQRQRVYEEFSARGYLFETVIHPSAVIAPEVQTAAGVQIMAGAVVQPGTCLGENAIVNTGARVDHDCRIDPHAHIAPGVTLSGHAHIGRGAHIGTGAAVVQGIRVGAASVVGAGAVVIDDVAPGTTVVGVPARPLERRNRLGQHRIA